MECEVVTRLVKYGRATWVSLIYQISFGLTLLPKTFNSDFYILSNPAVDSNDGH